MTQLRHTQYPSGPYALPTIHRVTYVAPAASTNVVETNRTSPDYTASNANGIPGNSNRADLEKSSLPTAASHRTNLGSTASSPNEIPGNPNRLGLVSSWAAGTSSAMRPNIVSTTLNAHTLHDEVKRQNLNESPLPTGASTLLFDVIGGGTAASLPDHEDANEPNGLALVPCANTAVGSDYQSYVAPRVHSGSAPKKMKIQSWNKNKITVILIGETGVGKTAMLNLLANVCAGVDLEDFKETHVFNNERGGTVGSSQTLKPVLYHIACADGKEVNILDTPGLADTRGIDKDNEHREAIANVIKEKIEVIDAVIILANGTVARLGAPTEYALNVVSGMFPHSIVNNIAFIFTMVSDPTEFNFDRASLQPAELQKARLWSMNNPLARWIKYQEKLNEGGLDEDILEDMDESVRRGYKKTINMLSQFFQWLDKCEVQPTHEIYNLYIMSQDIEASITNVLARMDQKETMHSQLKALQVDIDTQRQSKKMNEKYEEIIKTPFYEHEGTDPQYNTLCVYGGCYSNCHVDCGIGFTLERETLGNKCSAFWDSTGKGLQRVCALCGHLAKDHQHYRTKWVKKIKEDKVTDKEAKKRYDKAKTEEEKIGLLMQKVRKDIGILEKDRIDLENELSDLCDRYNKLALSGSFVGYISSTIRLLKIREAVMKKERATPDALQRMADRIKRLEETKKVVENNEKAKKGKFQRAVDTFNTGVDKVQTFVSGVLPAITA